MLLGFAFGDLVFFLGVSLLICITVCALAMEAAVLFTPSFLFVFPGLFPSFPTLTPNEAIGLAFIVEIFGYTSSVAGYWYRGQIDFTIAGALLLVSIPLAILSRIVSYVLPDDSLLLVFGLLLLGLAGVLYRLHPDGASRTCLLCGDAIVPMRGDGRGTRTPTPDSEDETATSNPRPEYHPRTSLLAPSENASTTFPLGTIDRGIVAVGALAGLVGIAIGEVSNTFLTVRRQIPIKISTGTSALVLHVTILSALLANLGILWLDPAFVQGEGIAIPWTIGLLLAPVVVAGGQIGSLLNSRLSDATIVRALIGAYVLVGFFVIGQTILL